MAVLKNKTQKNFTMISNNVLRDKELSMKDRGVLCTICSLPDGWDFSIAGLSAIVPDGMDAIRKSIFNLEKIGYIERNKTRGKNGKYISEIEVYTEKRTVSDLPSRENRHGEPITEKPSRENHRGNPVTENPTEYNTDNLKLNIKKDNVKSINLSEETDDSMDGEIEAYKNLIADNIKLDWLLEVAGHHGDVLNRIVDAELGIKNMSAYLISTLYTASLVGTIEAEANLHDDYLKYLRGNIY